MDLTEEEDAVAARTARYPSTSDSEETLDEGSESSGSATPPGDGQPGWRPSGIHGGLLHFGGHPQVPGVIVGRILDPRQRRVGYAWRALRRLNVALMQLNANAYRILISCFVPWAK
ncbi:hypothetical protein TIFTF001_044749 [Ficus carica]|uniref:Uncharacterized protein n=1 Tax=Ficus carica TaxID=3494 RepID=A0AA88A2D3_FICCA|nr:hypothetical protein TIFTF001_044749 [Ficus carica]